MTELMNAGFIDCFISTFSAISTIPKTYQALVSYGTLNRFKITLFCHEAGVVPCV